MQTEWTPVGGRRVVLYMYAASVLVAGGFGYILGATVFENAVEKGVVATLGPVTFPLTPINLALYGVVSVGAILGVLLGVVAWVAKQDDATPRDRNPQ
ncbi:DUF7520 family protein [Halospeciosus flavus]|uniref:Cox cluster protein n=1 Tax=Halospeciosus flavus TaxID=3032283 RepID=A0ABD5Z484_9EURY|nr:hypothetical protein [Halospeciosus flavus]